MTDRIVDGVSHVSGIGESGQLWEHWDVYIDGEWTGKRTGSPSLAFEMFVWGIRRKLLITLICHWWYLIDCYSPFLKWVRSKLPWYWGTWGILKRHTQRRWWKLWNARK